MKNTLLITTETSVEEVADFKNEWLQAKADEIMGDENRKVHDALIALVDSDDEYKLPIFVSNFDLENAPENLSIKEAKAQIKQNQMLREKFHWELNYDAKQGIINILAERYIREQLDVCDNQIGYLLDASGLDDYAFTGGHKAIFELEKQVELIKNFLNASD